VNPEKFVLQLKHFGFNLETWKYLLKVHVNPEKLWLQFSHRDFNLWRYGNSNFKKIHLSAEKAFAMSL